MPKLANGSGDVETLSDEVYTVRGLTLADYFDPEYLEGQQVRLISTTIWGTPVGYAPRQDYRRVCRTDVPFAEYNEVPARCLHLISEPTLTAEPAATSAIPSAEQPAGRLSL